MNDIVRLTVAIQNEELLIRKYWKDLKDLIDVYNRICEPIGHGAGLVWVLDADEMPKAHWTALFQYAQQPNLNRIVKRIAEFVADSACAISNYEQELHEIKEGLEC